MNAASIPQARSTLKRSLFSPIEGDLLTAFRDTQTKLFHGICEDEGGQFLVGGDYASNRLGNFEKGYQGWPKNNENRPMRTGPSLLKGAMFRNLSCEPAAPLVQKREDCAYQGTLRVSEAATTSRASALSLKRRTLR